MRIEKGFCAMGHELDSDISPIEAGLDFATRKAGGFIGARALAKRRAEGAVLQVVSLMLDDESAVPLGHEPIYLGDRIVGQTSSCAFGHRLGRPVALGHVRTPLETGAHVQVDIARNLFDATVTIGPLFDPDGARMKG
jgi:4-methylaminobutanoate oxidase (formaldehyde-forming)